jgi:dipeptidase
MCTSIIVGKKASSSGVLMLARNEDFPTNNKNKYLLYRQYPEYGKPKDDSGAPKESNWVLGNGLSVPVPDKCYGYSALPDADAYTEAAYSIGNRYFFEERGINTCNVAISATNSMESNKKALAADPFTAAGICESIIPTLILPQAETAVDAVRILGDYIETNGAGEANGVLVGDPDQTWYMEIGSGHQWIAVRVPDDSYIAVANGMRVHSVSLNSDAVRCSRDLYDFVEKNKLLKNPDPNDFNFALAFGVLGDQPVDESKLWYNEDRIWLIQSTLTPSLKLQPRQYQYPLFLKPDKKIGVQDVMAIMRSNYNGTALEHATPPATRPIGVDRTAESHIMTFADKCSDRLKGVLWQAIGTPLGSPYMPIFNVMDEVPSGYDTGENVYDPASAYWAFRGLYALAQVNNGEYLPELTRMWQDEERMFVAEYNSVIDTVSSLEKSGKEMANHFAKEYSFGNAARMVALANRKRDELMTNLTKKTDPPQQKNFSL